MTSNKMILGAILFAIWAAGGLLYSKFAKDKKWNNPTVLLVDAFMLGGFVVIGILWFFATQYLHISIV